MTNEEAAKMLTAKAECMKRESSGEDLDCNHRNCDDCELCYAQGTMGEQKEALKLAIEALRNSPSQMPWASDMISRCELFNRLANVKDLGEAFAVIQGMPTAEPDWTEMLVICDNCGHAIHVKRGEQKDIMRFPSVQPERKPGKWLIRRFGGDAQCSECGMYFTDAYDSENSDHYCRHCGTKMEGTALKLNGQDWR